MKRKVISLVISLSLLLTCVCLPNAIVMAAEDQSFVLEQNFDNIILEDGTTDLGAVSEAIGLDVTVSNSFFPNEVDGKFAFTKTEDGKLKIEGANLKTGTNLTIAHNFAEPVKTGVITFDVSLSDIKASNGSSLWRAARLAGYGTSSGTDYANLPNGSKAQRFHVVFSRYSEDEPWKEERQVTIISTGSITTTTKEYTATDTKSWEEFSAIQPLFSYLYAETASIVIDDISMSYQSMESLRAKINTSKNFDDGKLESEGSIAKILEETGLTVEPDTAMATKEGDYKVTTSNGRYEIHRKDGKGYRAYTTYKFPISVETGKLTVNLKYKPEGAAAINRYMFAPVSPTKSSSMFQFQPNPANGAWAGTVNVVDPLNTPLRCDDNGVYHFRMEISRNNTAEDWQAVLYDVKNPTAPGKLIEKTYSKDDYPSLTAIRLFAGWGDPLTSVYADCMDDFSVEYEEVKMQLSDVAFYADELSETPLENCTGLTQVTAKVTAFNPKGATDEFVMIVAAYTNNGKRLITADISEPFKPGTDSDDYKFTLTGFENADCIKVFFLDSTENLIPLRAQGVLSTGGFQQ